MTVTSALLVALAGCTGDDPGTIGDNSTTDPTDAPTSTGSTGGDESTTTEATEEPETETKTETETRTEENSQANVNIESKELVVDDSGYSTEKDVAAEVVNSGEGRSGSIKLTAEWYDSEGNYLDNDSQYLQTLGAGETWLAHVHVLVDDEKVEDFELSGEYNSQAQFDPEGFELTESEMNVGENEAVITGKVANNTGAKASYLEATATIYNSDGAVLGDSYTNTSGLPADKTWSFETSWRGRSRTGDATEHVVHIQDSV